MCCKTYENFYPVKKSHYKVTLDAPKKDNILNFFLPYYLQQKTTFSRDKTKYLPYQLVDQHIPTPWTQALDQVELQARLVFLLELPVSFLI